MVLTTVQLDRIDIIFEKKIKNDDIYFNYYFYSYKFLIFLTAVYGIDVGLRPSAMLEFSQLFLVVFTV